MSVDRLSAAIAAMKNPTVVGLDPDWNHLPECLKNGAETLQAKAEAVLAFNRRIIDAICDVVPAVKPQSAFYESYGWHGVKVLEETMQYASSKGMYVICDAKRGDIGSTAAAYAEAYLSGNAFTADALTVNPYLGSDGILPFVKQCVQNDKMIFVLVKTSNPSSGELQDLKCEGESLYRKMAALVSEWGKESLGTCGYNAVGAVVGATYPTQLAELRQTNPHTFFLVPGYGAQGGGAADVKPAFDIRGGGAIVNSSRAILTAWKKEGCPADFDGAARREALRMREALGEVL